MQTNKPAKILACLTALVVISVPGFAFANNITESVSFASNPPDLTSFTGDLAYYVPDSMLAGTITQATATFNFTTLGGPVTMPWVPNGAYSSELNSQGKTEYNYVTLYPEQTVSGTFLSASGTASSLNAPATPDSIIYYPDGSIYATYTNWGNPSNFSLILSTSNVPVVGTVGNMNIYDFPFTLTDPTADSNCTEAGCSSSILLNSVALTLDYTPFANPAATPLPPTIPLLLTGLGVLGFAARRKHT